MSVLAKDYIVKHKFFLAWQDEEEAKWLESMSKKGWHLVALKFGISYQFVKGEPKNYSYQLDYPGRVKDEADYLSIFEDTGWEYLGNFLFWRYFRKEATNNEKPVIYSDRNSKIERNKRLKNLLLLIGIAVFIIGLINFIISGVFTGIENQPSHQGNLIVSFIDFFSASLLFYGVKQIHQRNQRLKT